MARRLVRTLCHGALCAMLALGGVAAASPAQARAEAAQPSRQQIEATMKRATRFMVEKVSTNGGYVWSYLPDMSRRWGEMEAFPTMVWVQPPGTATMGNLFLDAYHATHDEYYYQAAEKAAGALIAGQKPSGGWHYFIDFGGEDSTRRWYDTIGKNAWRLEEFQHHWGNATFDDAGTSEAMQFLLRLYVEKHDARFKPALDKAIDFVLKSQYPIGGWPQRYPPVDNGGLHGRPDYTRYITFNDDVAGENIKFLIMVHQALGDDRVLDAITRAMSVYLVTQQGQPQPGWGLQHDPSLRPAGARTYEPVALATHATAANVAQLLNFYRLTGDSKYLARVPEALDWLDSVKLPPELVKDGRAWPTFIEIGTNRPLFIHRSGSNVANGRYFTNDDPADTVGHYSSMRALDVAGLRREYERLSKLSPEEASKGSPLKAHGIQPLAPYFLVDLGKISDLNTSRDAATPSQLVAKLNKAGWWPTELKATSHPYAGDGPVQPPPGDFRSTRVGDATDTSPYFTDKPVIGISTGTYIEHMATLISALVAKDGQLK
ncbi:PelA/Pel-15E family pectate lyase [Sphingopyxis sp. OAS728]|uniref:pectate lyase n=1 Tax=Sphingopyxis sp. OAS728 TaxID=2663823 RepID=UPI0019DFF743|nr:pectate lyase [Sphingopyxis sp. OAS728]MBE1529027.1 PelA/Pel-15E family pectate lyase [Sphingopyxis sp. OAS728]